MTKANTSTEWNQLADCVCEVAAKRKLSLASVARQTNFDYRTLHRWLIQRAYEPSASVALIFLAWIMAITSKGSPKTTSKAPPIPLQMIKRWAEQRVNTKTK